MTAEDLATAQSAENFVRVRDIVGGPAPSTTRAALELEKKQYDSDQIWLGDARGRLRDAEQALDDAVNAATS